MNYEQMAQQLGHKQSVIDAYKNLKETTMSFNNEHVSELDIIFFLRNILWSSNFELIAKIIIDYGMESRLEQWMDEINKINALPTNQQEDEDAC